MIGRKSEEGVRRRGGECKWKNILKWLKLGIGKRNQRIDWSRRKFKLKTKVSILAKNFDTCNIPPNITFWIIGSPGVNI